MINLTRCFPDTPKAELIALLPNIYRNITDVLLETIKAFSLSPAGILKYVQPPAPDQLVQYHLHFRGAIIVTAHLANWEWCGYCLTEILHDAGIAVYRPLKNPRIDALMRCQRQKSGMKIVPMRQIVKLLSKNTHDPHFVLLIADQNPDRDNAVWEKFFGIPTAFFKGPAALARRYDLPVFFVHLERTGRHKYRMHLEAMCLEPASVDVDEITQMYVRTLEQHIRSAPESWLWTHRRWKHESPGR